MGHDIAMKQISIYHVSDPGVRLPLFSRKGDPWLIPTQTDTATNNHNQSPSMLTGHCIFKSTYNSQYTSMITKCHCNHPTHNSTEELLQSKIVMRPLSTMESMVSYHYLHCVTDKNQYRPYYNLIAIWKLCYHVWD